MEQIQTIEPGVETLNAVVEDMRNNLKENQLYYNEGVGEYEPTDPINHNFLEIKKEYETDEDDPWNKELTSIIFVGGTGGPHYEFRFHLHTQKLTFHYWTWFYSDLYETGLTGAQEDTLKEVLRNYFDAYYNLGVEL